LLSSTHSSFNVGNVVQPGPGQNNNSGCTEDSNTGLFTPTVPGNPTFFNCAAFLDPNASGLVAARGYTFGNMPRITGEVRSHGYVNEDFSIIKRVSLFESHALILKAELFNAFNRHVFTRFDTGIQSSTLGASFGSINNPRNVQFTLRYQF
jgi:hypothetical protein